MKGMLRFYTAGESHGQALLAFISGLPAQMPIELKFINHELASAPTWLWTRRTAKNRKDTADIFAGSAPRQDHWRTDCSPDRESRLGQLGKNPARRSGRNDPSARKLVAPRPGHADLAGSQKFDYHDARYILERASARETAARVAAGAFAKLLLREFGTEIAATRFRWARETRKAGQLEKDPSGERGPGFSFAVH